MKSDLLSSKRQRFCEKEQREARRFPKRNAVVGSSRDCSLRSSAMRKDTVQLKCCWTSSTTV